MQLIECNHTTDLPIKAELEDVSIFTFFELENKDQKVITGYVQKHDMPLWEVGDCVALGPVLMYDQIYALQDVYRYKINSVKTEITLSVFDPKFMRGGISKFSELTTRWDRRSGKLNYE